MFSFRSNQKCRLTFFPRFARRRRLYSESGAEDKTASSDEVNVREAAGNPHERFRAVWFCHLSRSFVFVVASKKRGGGYSWCSTQKRRPKTKATTKRSRYKLNPNNRRKRIDDVFTHLDHVPSFYLFHSAHAVPVLAVHLHLDVSRVRAHVLAARAHLIKRIYTTLRRSHE